MTTGSNIKEQRYGATRGGGELAAVQTKLRRLLQARAEKGKAE